MEHSLKSLIDYRRRVGAIVKQYPHVRDSAVVQYTEFMQKLWNLEDIDLQAISTINHQIYELFALDSKIKSNLDEILADVESQINKKEKELTLHHAMNLGLRYRSFSTYPANKVDELRDDSDLCNYITSQIESRIDFAVPGLILGGELAHIMTSMVGADPLYACMHESHFYDFKKVVDNDFYYNSRLRHYPYTTFDLSDLDQLPQNQFGLIVACGHIDMQPAFNLQAYFGRIKSLLRPGGTCVFTFFDLDIDRSLLNFENQMATAYARLAQIRQEDKTWWKKLALHPNCQKLAVYSKIIQASGLKLVSYRPFNYQSVVIIEKYGNVETVKALQASGEIINLPQ